MPKAIFCFAGEGAHSAPYDLAVLSLSPSWPAVDSAILAQHGMGTAEFLSSNLGKHGAPYSPVVTTVINLLQADLWRLWGHQPAYALGHSVGEVCCPIPPACHISASYVL